ncbi:hypothetical protein LCGC14_2050280 [marine sediment metagenome]|uniref:Uncharacterized protein n=1 Tax=marine sediment metagenome TaxID=412755 RepID=A0A0F9EP78_9ZZZZ
MKYTIRQHYRRLQGRCLRYGCKRGKKHPSSVILACGGYYARHLWKMR